LESLFFSNAANKNTLNPNLHINWCGCEPSRCWAWACGGNYFV